MSCNENWLRRSRRNRTAAPRTSRPSLEALEDRWMPSVTNHGGAVLANVEINAVYYGSTWASDPNQTAVSGQLSNFLSTVVDSPYMDMLGKAGYGIGRGSLTGITLVDRSADDLGNILHDSEIRSYLQNSINDGSINAPDPNRLYVVFVEPNVEVINDNYYDYSKPGLDDSVNDFAGYHQNFMGTDANGNAISIRYAVIPTPGGTVNNAYTAGESYLSTIDEMTQATSHELAEAVTDPDVSTGTLGWYDDTYTNPNGSTGAEIGDIFNGQTVRMYGYAVQAVSDQNDNAISPAAVSFPDSHFAATSGKGFTTTLAVGSDPTGLTDVNNLGAYILWGDGTANYGTVTQDAQGNFDVIGSHTYGKGGSYQAEIYVFDSSNSSNYSISYDSVTVLAAPTKIPPPVRRFATGFGLSGLQQGGAQQALALDPAVTHANAAVSRFSASEHATTPAFATGQPAGSAFAPAAGATPADSNASGQSHAPAIAAGVGGAGTHLADAVFGSLSLDPFLRTLVA